MTDWGVGIVGTGVFSFGRVVPLVVRLHAPDMRAEAVSRRRCRSSTLFQLPLPPLFIQHPGDFPEHLELGGYLETEEAVLQSGG